MTENAAAVFADTGKVFFGSLIGGVAATGYLQNGSLYLYAFSIAILPLAFLLFWTIESQIKPEDSTYNRWLSKIMGDSTEAVDPSPRLNTPSSSKPSTRYR
ncbi:hypothetical protein [Halosolutus gelatinilyticus]|uniref:hypothetical protein n=1 Tax=Halosolutus gelatinilyticus TaxID=2931975 RepID=UPI001FF62438|nr:hypothetical protein [Halosolutus gelatinilyticus]